MKKLLRTCPSCGKTIEIQVPLSGYFAWFNSVPIQDAFPELSAAEYETLISGTCEICQNKNF